MVPQTRIELMIDDYKSTVIPFNYKGYTLYIKECNNLLYLHHIPDIENLQAIVPIRLLFRCCVDDYTLYKHELFLLSLFFP